MPKKNAVTIQPTCVESEDIPNSCRMSGKAGSIRSMARAPLAIRAVTMAMNSRPLATPLTRAPCAVDESVNNGSKIKFYNKNQLDYHICGSSGNDHSKESTTLISWQRLRVICQLFTERAFIGYEPERKGTNRIISPRQDH